MLIPSKTKIVRVNKAYISTFGCWLYLSRAWDKVWEVVPGVSDKPWDGKRRLFFPGQYDPYKIMGKLAELPTLPDCLFINEEIYYTSSKAFRKQSYDSKADKPLAAEWSSKISDVPIDRSPVVFVNKSPKELGCTLKDIRDKREVVVHIFACENTDYRPTFTGLLVMCDGTPCMWTHKRWCGLRSTDSAVLAIDQACRLLEKAGRSYPTRFVVHHAATWLEVTKRCSPRSNSAKRTLKEFSTKIDNPLISFFVGLEGKAFEDHIDKTCGKKRVPSSHV